MACCRRRRRIMSQHWSSWCAAGVAQHECGGHERGSAVREFHPERIVLLPLYPQYSTTTTASSFADWRRAAAAAGLATDTRSLCCYPVEPGLIEAMAGLAAAARTRLPAGDKPPRFLFS